MKKLFIVLFTLGITVQAFAQDVLFEVKLAKEKVPTVIIESVQEDFPGFIMEEFDAVPIEYVEDDVIVNKNFNSDEDYDTYEISLSSKGRHITAIYDKKGTLISLVEKIKNAILPIAVVRNVEKAYPGWAFEKDNYKMVHYNGLKEKKRYKITLEKGIKRMKVYTDANGKILNKNRTGMMKSHRNLKNN
jgi:hypothetical protein